MARLNRFSEERGYVTIDQWEPLDVRQFRSTWPVSPQTAVRRMAMLKPFFEYCVSNKWMGTNPARAVKKPKGREMANRGNEQKFPFTDDEIKRMYEACEKYGGPIDTNGTARIWRISFRGRSTPAFAFPTWRCFTLIGCSQRGNSCADHQGRHAP
jgi:integrase